MTKRPMSEHAKAAKIIRQELKANGIKGSVTSSTYAGGTSIRVSVENLAPWILERIERFTDKFEYGHFDGMTDCYEYSNSRDDVPQVKYLFVTCTFSDELRQQAYDYLRANWGGYENHPESYDEARSLMGAGHWVSDEVWQVLNGSWDATCSELKFWKKPHVRLAA